VSSSVLTAIFVPLQLLFRPPTEHILEPPSPQHRTADNVHDIPTAALARPHEVVEFHNVLFSVVVAVQFDLLDQQVPAPYALFKSFGSSVGEFKSLVSWLVATDSLSRRGDVILATLASGSGLGSLFLSH
jgi:hypothetical protein